MQQTPLGALARGLAAGLAGTAVMTGYQLAVQRLRGQNGKKPRRWVDASVAAQVGRRISEGVFEHKVTLKDEPKLTNIVHFTYGAAWGGAYGLAQGSFHAPALPHGLGFGTAVWGVANAALPSTGLSEPLWRQPAKELALDLSYNLVYGAAVAGAYRALERI